MTTKMVGIVALLIAICAIAFFMYRRNSADAARRATDDARNAAAARAAAAGEASAKAAAGGGALDSVFNWVLKNPDSVKEAGFQIGNFFGGDNLTAG